MDKGPWEPGSSYDEKKSLWRYYVESQDFTHDVRLYISGDFADAGEYEEYAAFIAAKLNAAVIETHDADLEKLLPPMPTAADIKRIREETGEGMMTIKAQFERERTDTMINTFEETGDTRLLAHILRRFLKKSIHNGY